MLSASVVASATGVVRQAFTTPRGSSSCAPQFTDAHAYGHNLLGDQTRSLSRAHPRVTLEPASSSPSTEPWPERSPLAQVTASSTRREQT
jgi:hypothetical protein